MIRAAAFARRVIAPAIEILAGVEPRIDSPSARVLLLGTAIQESGLAALEQRGGPALGFFQIEPATLADVYHRYLAKRRPDLLAAVDGLKAPGIDAADQLAGNMLFACAIARIRFWMVPAPPLPAADDLDGLGEYWDRFYNRNPAHGTAAEWVAAYRRYAD